MITLCTAVGLFCAVAPPDLPALQSAYEREMSAGSVLHDKNLKLLDAKCTAGSDTSKYLCEVSFTSTADPAQRLYFDVVAIASAESGWTLQSGLCRR